MKPKSDRSRHSSNHVSVIVVSFNTQERLRECLRSVLAQQDVPAPQVIVVDNASMDGSADMVRDEYPQVELIANQRNLGFAAGNNQALQHCHGHYILLLNPDTVLLEGSLAAMVSFLGDHPDAGVVGAKLLNPDGALQPSCFRFPTLAMLLLDFFPIHSRLLNSRLNGRYPAELYDTIFTIDHPLGACMMVRREAIDQVGPLDEGFFMYCEEVDWCFRMRKAGWRNYFLPTAQAIHFGGESTKQRRNEMFVELHRSR
ncbi:MAG: glycosyltransferase family 2 protein, partial [Chloroflexi bacterium]|nr:glycosyltransferase family 2 protein [Chloroflexota bacterium]